MWTSETSFQNTGWYKFVYGYFLSVLIVDAGLTGSFMQPSVGLGVHKGFMLCVFFSNRLSLHIDARYTFNVYLGLKNS